MYPKLIKLIQFFQLTKFIFLKDNFNGSYLFCNHHSIATIGEQELIKIIINLGKLLFQHKIVNDDESRKNHVI